MTTPRTRSLGRLAGLLLAGLLAGAMLPGSAAAARTYSIDVSARADFVPQTNFVQCVGASMQMMLNMIEPGRDRSAKTQLRLQRLARAWSGTRPDGRERQGASVRGWAAGLNIEGGGPYKLVGASTLDEALLTAARAIAETGKPVGLLVWRGRHAWVMSGFKATGDPMTDPNARVTAANIHDPLYPHGSSAWGPSPRPGEAISVQEVGRQFVQRRMNTSWLNAGVSGPPSQLGGKWVLVLPYTPDLSARLSITR
ncbi:MAG TPA: hypothetical protein VD763_09980 [Candidatus Saccharimonadales bacterium]|nr:hypothetical protein [Candidatus Saccharimonadales bacterium]